MNSLLHHMLMHLGNVFMSLRVRVGTCASPSLSLARSLSLFQVQPTGVPESEPQCVRAAERLELRALPLFSPDPGPERLPRLRTCARRNYSESNANYLVATEKISVCVCAFFLFLSERSA